MRQGTYRTKFCTSPIAKCIKLVMLNAIHTRYAVDAILSCLQAQTETLISERELQMPCHIKPLAWLNMSLKEKE